MKLPLANPEQGQASVLIDSSANGQGNPTFERLGECLYRKGGTIYARVRVNGKLTWKSTETNEQAKARKWLEKWRNEEWMVNNGFELQGVVLHRQRVTVRELIEEYDKAGYPTKKMQAKVSGDRSE